MNINVPQFARAHFWEEPPSGSAEFWSFRFKPPCSVGDELIFRFDGVPVARAIVYEIQKPGVSQCEGTGRFRNGWKVIWLNESFVDLRARQHIDKLGDEAVTPKIALNLTP